MGRGYEQGKGNSVLPPLPFLVTLSLGPFIDHISVETLSVPSYTLTPICIPLKILFCTVLYMRAGIIIIASSSLSNPAMLSSHFVTWVYLYQPASACLHRYLTLSSLCIQTPCVFLPAPFMYVCKSAFEAECLEIN